MLDKRSKMIIDEINFWKEHKILPESYCDYLINLYSKGEPIEKDERNSWWSGGRALLLIQLSLILLMIPFSFLVIYFTELHMLMQIGILSLFMSYSLWVLYDLKKRHMNYVYIPLLAMLFFILISTEYLVRLIIEKHWVSGVIIFLNFFMWFVIGRKVNIKYVKYCGMIGLCMVCFYFVYKISYVVL